MLPTSEPIKPILPPATVLKAGALLLLGLWAGKVLVGMNEIAGQLCLTLMIAFQLYVPYTLLQRKGLNPEKEGLHVHGLILGPIAGLRKWAVYGLKEKRLWRFVFIKPIRQWLAYHGRHAALRPTPLLGDLKRVMMLVLITFPPFAIGHHFFQIHVGGHSEGFAFQLPPDLFVFVIFQILLVALPEELFYRGFMLVSLNKSWPNKAYLFGIPIGRAVIVSSLFFALAHFVGEYNVLRLGPFFPAFLFSYLMLKSQSLLGAISYHALSNIFSQILFVGYQAS